MNKTDVYGFADDINSLYQKRSNLQNDVNGYNNWMKELNRSLDYIQEKSNNLWWEKGGKWNAAQFASADYEYSKFVYFWLPDVVNKYKSRMENAWNAYREANSQYERLQREIARTKDSINTQYRLRAKLLSQISEIDKKIDKINSSNQSKSVQSNNKNTLGKSTSNFVNIGKKDPLASSNSCGLIMSCNPLINPSAPKQEKVTGCGIDRDCNSNNLKLDRIVENTFKAIGGAFEMGVGLLTAGGCTAATGATAGLSAPGTIPCIAAGLFMSANGGVNMNSGIYGLMFDDDRNLKIDALKNSGASDEVAGIVAASTDVASMAIGAGAISKIGTVSKILSSPTVKSAGLVMTTTGFVGGSIGTYEGIQKCYNSKCSAEDFYNLTLASETTVLSGMGMFSSAKGMINETRIFNDYKNISKTNDFTYINNDITTKSKIGSALKLDKYHAFPDIIDNYATDAVQYNLKTNTTLYQLGGSLNGKEGRFEWIVQDGKVTHRMFVKDGILNGDPIKK